MNTKKKNARGITLIALVITIIVLLILAGVTINALSGENGIITKATDAKEKPEENSIKIDQIREIQRKVVEKPIISKQKNQKQ